MHTYKAALNKVHNIGSSAGLKVHLCTCCSATDTNAASSVYLLPLRSQLELQQLSRLLQQMPEQLLAAACVSAAAAALCGDNFPAALLAALRVTLPVCPSLPALVQT